ncbi:MAG TPA: DUF3311 domain-containing protein [Mycobacteriales bacterium]|nr:DUF3311 domain-containing protein [Mycobacteriales bacterium]
MASRPVSEPQEPGTGPVHRGDPTHRDDRSAWHWLLLVPLVVVLIPQLYNKLQPTLFGIPFFYWYQLAVIAVGVGCTLVVYQKTRR